MTDKLEQSEEQAVLERIVRAQLLKKQLEEEIELLKGYFKERPEAYPAGATITRGKFYVKVSENGRIDDTLAREVLGLSGYRQVAKLTVDPKLARRRLSGEQIEQITKKFANRLEVGLVD